MTISQVDNICNTAYHLLLGNQPVFCRRFVIPHPLPISHVRSIVGESAAWSIRDNCLFTVDIWGRLLWRHTDGGGAERFEMPEMAAAVVIADSGIVVALESHMLLGDPRLANWRKIAPPGDHPETHRFNDATVAPDGSLIIGTMRKSALGAEPTGVLYRWAAGSWTRLAEGFWTVNGLAFSPDGKILYFSDSHTSVQTVWTAAYAEGQIGAPHVFVDFTDLAGRPDGGATDAEGCYWSAAVGGGCLHRFRPDGTRERTVILPVDNPTRPAFGGPGLATLFVTTMAERQTNPDPGGLAGATFALTAPCAGHKLPLLKTGFSLSAADETC
ncbi:SMP-30/gluconolactonase/LRE family protein [Sphingobium algorifonticola]|nr:SMP-30/gluconolactonase/LRE family protein [Sphingobium algorifonticola]